VDTSEVLAIGLFGAFWAAAIVFFLTWHGRRRRGRRRRQPSEGDDPAD
jgi:hypothetical protein